MELHEYPRPANDTGIGVHWTVGFASAIGIGRIRDFWIPELKALGVKWVKIFNHDGAIDFAELLLSEGIMPIVRIFRPSPNPSTLDVREVVHLDAFIRAGVRYFEFNSEPDRDSEWKGGRVPANGFELAVDHTIANLETILERGGMPGIPAVSNGSRWDIVGRIVAKGRKDLFNGPVWQAVHNYSRNRPLDYPYDSGNQEGAAFSQRFYDAVGNSEWGEDPWRGRSLTDVNRLRLDRSNPGANIMDDHACWLAYEFFDACNRKHLGRSIPILSTECGYLVGEDIDPRYPATTPDLHMAQTLEACRIMMGSSQRFQIAPDYYFCSAFWLLGNSVLGSSSNWWEHNAWYSEKWPSGSLPITYALKAEPRKVRQWQHHGAGRAEIGARAVLRGTVSHAGEHRTLVLEQNGREVARSTLDANSRYVMGDLPAGNYLLRVEGAAVEQPVSLPPNQETVHVNLDLAQIGADSGGSIIEGTVRGGAGAVVVLLRASDGEDWVTMAKDNGTFRFVELAKGAYTLRVQSDGNTDLLEDRPLQSPDVEFTLDGRNRQQVELVMPGWGYTVQRRESDGKSGRIQCAVRGRNGLRVQASLNGWRSEPVLTGSAPELGEYACEIGSLEPGYYTLTVESDPESEPGEGSDADATRPVNAANDPVRLQAFVQVDKNATPFVEFVYNQPAPERAPAAANSAIHGRVIGGYEPGRRLHVWLTDQAANRREQLIGEDCTFAFERLSSGLYSVEVSGYADEARRADIALDGRNTVQVELMIPVEETPEAPAAETSLDSSVVAGRVPEGAGRRARLVDTVGNELKQVVEPDHTFCFDGLAAGVYTLTVEGGYEQSDLTLDGSNGLEVVFQPLEMHWEHKASPAGSMPGYSVIRVEVEGMRGLPVYIWKEDWEGMMRRTGSKPEYGECSAEFSPLGPGIYMVEPEGLDVYADIELTGLEVVWVDFRRRAAPVRPHEVRPMAHGSRSLNGNTESYAGTAWESERESAWESASEHETYGDEWTSAHGDQASDTDTDDAYELPGETFGSLRFDTSSFDSYDAPASESSTSDASSTDRPSDHYSDEPRDQAGDSIWGLPKTAHSSWAEDAQSIPAHADDARSETHEETLDETQEPAPHLLTPDSTANQPAQEKCYLYLVEEVQDMNDQIALLRYVARTQPGVGQDIEEALDADLVLIVAPSLDELTQAGASPHSSGEQALHTPTSTALFPQSEDLTPAADDVPGQAPEQTAAQDAPEAGQQDNSLQDSDLRSGEYTGHEQIDEEHPEEEHPEEEYRHNDIGDFDWEPDEDADLDAMWPDWPTWEASEPETDPDEDASLDADFEPAADAADDDALAQDIFSTRGGAEDIPDEDAPGNHVTEDDVTDDIVADNPTTDADAGAETAPDRTEATGEASKPPSIDDLYSAWIAASERNSRKDQSVHASGDDSDSEAHDNAEAVESEEPHRGLHPSASSATSADLPESTLMSNRMDTATPHDVLLAQVEAIEARLRARGVRFERLSGKLAAVLSAR